MGRRGPRPKPTQLKVIQGTFRKDRAKDEPKPRPIAPACPRWLDAMARAEWRQVAPALERLGLLTEVDGAGLAAYCDAYARWRRARAALTRKLTAKAPSGYLMQLPEVAIANNAAKVMLAFMREFGLTPSARVRLELPAWFGREEEDEFEEFVRRGKAR